MPAGTPGVHRLSTGPALGVRTFLCAAAAVLLMLVDQRTALTETPRSLLMTLVYPLQEAVGVPARLLDWSDDATRTRAELALENNRLKRQRLLADARLQQLNAIRAENERLREMLDARPRVGTSVRVAQILEVDTDPFRHRVVINKGSNDGVFERQAIIDANGIVGQVLRVGAVSATVLLISDPEHAVQVEVVRNGLRTVAFGSGDYDQLEIRFLPNNADIEVGDLLVTTSLGGDYPAGYPVAEVVAVEQQPRQAFARVTASPAAALTRMREVLLLEPEAAPEPPAAAPETEATDDGGG